MRSRIRSEKARNFKSVLDGFDDTQEFNNELI
jgi:hypothetical protein